PLPRSPQDPDWVFPSAGTSADPVSSWSDPADDWLGLPADVWSDDVDYLPGDARGESSQRSRRGSLKRFAAGAALLVSGVVGGAAVVNAWQGSDAAPVASGIGAGGGAGGQGFPGSGQGLQGQQGQGFSGGGQGQQGQGFPGSGQGQQGQRFGAADGEQRFIGVVTSVGSATITVRAAQTPDGQSAAGTQTYAVTGDTEIGLDGARATLGDFSAGDVVLVHVLPQQEGGHDVLERLLGRSGDGSAQLPLRPGDGRGGDDVGPGRPDDGSDSTSTTGTRI
ncbi:MAG: hypothetical protein ACTHNT_06300, partial [Actinomycetales bacterium]